MWIRCHYDGESYEHTINFNIVSGITYGNKPDNINYFYFNYNTSWKHIILKKITGKEMCLHIEKLIGDNFNGVLVIDDELERLISGKFETLEEFNNK